MLHCTPQETSVRRGLTGTAVQGNRQVPQDASHPPQQHGTIDMYDGTGTRKQYLIRLARLPVLNNYLPALLRCASRPAQMKTAPLLLLAASSCLLLRTDAQSSQCQVSYNAFGSEHADCRDALDYVTNGNVLAPLRRNLSDSNLDTLCSGPGGSDCRATFLTYFRHCITEAPGLGADPEVRPATSPYSKLQLARQLATGLVLWRFVQLPMSRGTLATYAHWIAVFSQFYVGELDTSRLTNLVNAVCRKDCVVAERYCYATVRSALVGGRGTRDAPSPPLSLQHGVSITIHLPALLSAQHSL